MALCNAPRDASPSSFRATPPVPSRPGIRSALAIAGLALGHTPHAQRRPSLDQMGVQRLPLPMAPGIRSALALAGLAPGMDVRRNFRSRGAITARRSRVPVSVILARPHPSQQAASFLACTRTPDFVASRRSSTAAALPPTDSGPRAFRGLNHLEGFLPLPSEGYNISKARTSSMADLLLLRNFSTLYSLFSCLMFSHTSSCLGTYSICVHHPSMFCAYHLSHPFSTCVFLAYFSLLSFYVHP
jgi:hypothetical protein